MSRLKQSYKKLLIILLSRFKKTKKAQWIEDRKKECDKCPFNTKNMDKLPFTKSFVKNISDFYSFITRNGDLDVLGNCSACEMCSIYYKTETDVEYCPKNKWGRQKLQVYSITTYTEKCDNNKWKK